MTSRPGSPFSWIINSNLHSWKPGEEIFPIWSHFRYDQELWMLAIILLRPLDLVFVSHFESFRTKWDQFKHHGLHPNQKGKGKFIWNFIKLLDYFNQPNMSNSSDMTMRTQSTSYSPTISVWMMLTWSISLSVITMVKSDRVGPMRTTVRHRAAQRKTQYQVRAKHWSVAQQLLGEGMQFTAK